MTAKRDERGVVIPLDGVDALEGRFVAGRPGLDEGAVIAPPHPLYGGSMDSPVVNELAYAAGRSGLATLCFNWRGVGASAGEASGDPGDALADYRAALAHLGECLAGGLVACGYSFGAVAALRALSEEPRVRRAVLVAPPAELLRGEALPGESLLLVTGECDALARTADLARWTEGSPNARLEIVPEADHFFTAGLAELGRRVHGWLGDPGG